MNEIRWSFLLSAVVGAALTCSATSPGEPIAQIAWAVVAPASNAIATVTIEVTGPGIDSTLVFNLTLISGTATGTARVPAGSGRHIVAKGFDAAGVLTNRGDTTVTLVEGTNPALTIQLAPLVGNVAITLTFGTYVVALSGRDTTMSVGDTVRYVATATDYRGRAVSSDSVRWATSNPAVASVGATGKVQALLSGQTSIGVTYNGTGASRIVTVR